jgi:hypothetical protein
MCEPNGTRKRYLPGAEPEQARDSRFGNARTTLPFTGFALSHFLPGVRPFRLHSRARTTRSEHALR